MAASADAAADSTAHSIPGTYARTTSTRVKCDGGHERSGAMEEVMWGSAWNLLVSRYSLRPPERWAGAEGLGVERGGVRERVCVCVRERECVCVCE